MEQIDKVNIEYWLCSNIKGYNKKVSIEEYAKSILPYKNIFICKNLIIRNIASDKFKRIFDKTILDSLSFNDAVKKMREEFKNIISPYMKDKDYDTLSCLIKEFGCPDLLILDDINNNLFFIEVKSFKDGLKDSQFKWIVKARKSGYETKVLKFIK
jgi:hypothetical protein